MADEYAKAAAEGGQPNSDVPDEHRWETSLSHMTRVATEARSRTAAQWIADRLGNPRRKYRPPPLGEGSDASSSEGCQSQWQGATTVTALALALALALTHVIPRTE